MLRSLLAAVLLGTSAFAQAPVFEAAKVQIPNSNDTTPLGPGELISVYGSDLGPEQACQGREDPNQQETPNPRRSLRQGNNLRVFPKELCGVRVLVGGEPAGLLYVHRDQINFKVPQNVPMEGTVGLQIIQGNQASAVVQIEAGLIPLRLILPERTFTDMPIWVQVKIPPNRGVTIQYPYSYIPDDIGCNELQLRKDGRLLERTFPASGGPGVGSGPMCGSRSYGDGYDNRLPLHLAYRIDQPGNYEVRLNMGRESRRQGGAKTEFLLQSEWTPLLVEASTADQRRRWLDGLVERPPVARADLLGDYLPSILGAPDEASLNAVVEQLYHLDPRVARYAEQALRYWPESTANQALLGALERRGPSYAVVDWLVSQSKDRRHALSVVEAALPYLRSSNPVHLRGAFRAVSGLRWLEESPERDELNAQATTILLTVERTILASGDEESQRDYIQQLGFRKDVRGAPILWRFVDEGTALGMTLQSLAQIARPEDLPRLAEFLLASNMSRDYYSEVADLPGTIAQSYGAASFGYLQRLIAETDNARLRNTAGSCLVHADLPESWAFIAAAIESDAPYKADLMRHIAVRYPESNATQASMLALAKRLAAGQQP